MPSPLAVQKRVARLATASPELSDRIDPTRSNQGRALIGRKVTQRKPRGRKTLIRKVGMIGRR